MSPEDIRKLLGGYAAGTLTEAEQQAFPCFRRRHAARGPVEEANAEMLLERLNMIGDGAR